VCKAQKKIGRKKKKKKHKKKKGERGRKRESFLKRKRILWSFA